MTPDQRRDEIVQAARRVMGDFGVRRATVGDVAAAVGLSRQTVYEYFPSRAALVQAALTAGARDVVATGVASAEAAGGDARMRLERLVTAAIGFFRTSGLWATPGKRAELSAFVALEGGVYLGAGTQALAAALSSWWPDTDPARIDRAADTLARALVSHGLAPEDADAATVGAGLAQLIADGLR